MNRFLIIFLFVLSQVGNSCAQKSKEKPAAEKQSPQDRDTAKKAPANKFTEIPIVDTSTILNNAASSDKKNKSIMALGWVSDYEHIFSTREIFILDSIIVQFKKKTSSEIAILTIDSSFTTKENFDSLILFTAKEWTVGKKGINNGVVMGISKGLRRIRIVNGYGIEGKLSDVATKKIMDNEILPAFKEGKYFEGTKNGLLAIMEKIR